MNKGIDGFNELNTYNIHINLYDVALLMAAFTGLVFALQLWFVKKERQGANRLLGLATGAMVLWTGGELGADIGLGRYVALPEWLSIGIPLAIGPFLFFYVRKITCPEYKFRVNDLLHFSPLLLQFVLKSAWPGAAVYNMLPAFISISIYLCLCHILIERFYRRQEFNGGDRHFFELRWLHILIKRFGLLWLLWIPFAAVNYFYLQDLMGTMAWRPFYLLAAVMISWIGAAAFLKPEDDMQAEIPLFPKPQQQAGLRQKGAWLKRTMVENRYYQDPELSLSSLAGKLDLSTHELSRIINTVLKKNFNDFINEYRIQAVIQKMQDPAYDHITLLGIAFESGFNAQSSFSRIFKQLTGKTPLKYKNEPRKELPFYNLRSNDRLAPIISFRQTTYKWPEQKLNRNTMFKNYLKIAWRSLLRNKTQSIINVAGLSVGMAVALLIGLWVYDEVSFDRYHQHYDRIGQIMTTQTSNSQTVTFGLTVVPLAAELRNKYGADFESVVLTAGGKHILSAGETKIAQDGLFAEPGLPALLSLKMVRGRYSSFADPSALLVSESTAKVLFGAADPIGKVVRIDNYKNLNVAGVYQDLPGNTSFNANGYLMPWSSPLNSWSVHPPQWDNHGVQVLAQLKPAANFDKISARIKNITTPYNKSINETIQLFPMSGWHLYSRFENGVSVGGRIQIVRLFGIIGLFVLLLACINFMNLSTAQSEKKAKQVGIRKAIGSLRVQLIAQFLSESIIMVFVAFLLAMVLVWLSIPSFNLLAGKQVTLPWAEPLFWLAMIGFTLITGLLAGSYPAFYLSGFSPVKVLKGTFKIGPLAAIPRKVLVVAQFTVSIVLIIGTIIVFRQIQYAQSRDVGYTRAGLITIEMNTPEIQRHYEVMRNDLITSGGATNMAESSNATTELGITNTGFTWAGQAPGFDPTFGNVFVSPDFGQTIGWQIIEGRDFSRDNPADTGAIILNESALKLTGIKKPIGKTIHWFNKDHVITGIVKDLVMESPYSPVKATVFQMKPDWVNRITVRLNPDLSVHSAISKIEPVFKKFNPGSPFEYKFNDEEYAKKFSDERRVGSLAMIFAVLAILISCLGMFGMASFTAERRVKEIGVRKVLGAGIFNLWGLLSAEFLKLVLLSLVIAIPAAYLVMHSWLQNFTYQTPMSWWIFVSTGIAALLITLATVSYQSIKAALINPVKSLRSE